MGRTISGQWRGQLTSTGLEAPWNIKANTLNQDGTDLQAYVAPVLNVAQVQARPPAGTPWTIIGWSVAAVVYFGASAGINFFAQPPRIIAGMTTDQVQGGESIPEIPFAGPPLQYSLPSSVLDSATLFDGAADTVPLVNAYTPPATPNRIISTTLASPIAFDDRMTLSFFLYTPPYLSGVHLAGPSSQVSPTILYVSKAVWRLIYTAAGDS